MALAFVTKGGAQKTAVCKSCVLKAGCKEVRWIRGTGLWLRLRDFPRSGGLKLVDNMLPILEQELLAHMTKGFRSRRGYQVTTAFPLRMA